MGPPRNLLYAYHSATAPVTLPAKVAVGETALSTRIKCFKQNRYGKVAHFSLLGWFAYNWIRWGSIEPGLVWGVWFFLLLGLIRASGGVGHPPTEPGELSPGRKAIAVGTLVLFVLLFMPTPLRQQALVARTFL